jgi:ubiquinone/menaquinone biosynthesis C-methylase UbiE
MSTTFGPGFHATPGLAVDASAYDQWTGRWSRLFVAPLLSAARVADGHRVLDVATGTGEAALTALSAVGASGSVIGADVAPEMLMSARDRLNNTRYLTVAANGQSLPFENDAFDTVICQLGLQFFADPLAGLTEFRRVLRPGGITAVCVIATADRAPMWGHPADVICRFAPQHRETLYLSFSLSDPERLESLCNNAGLHDVRVERVRREDTVGSFDEYWSPIEAGIGSIAKVYFTLTEKDRRSVREEVRASLARYELSDGKLRMGIEMLIGSGRA